MRQSLLLKREQKAQAWKFIIANHIFNDHLYNKDLAATCKSICRYRSVIKKFLKCMEDETIRIGSYPDPRTGDETYGYKSLESIEGNLDYISDRFSAEFRLRWLLEVPEKVDKLNE